MNLECWFSVPIWYKENIFDAEKFFSLKSMCYTIRKEDVDGIKVSNVGGWHSHYFNLLKIQDFGCSFFIDFLDQTTKNIITELDNKNLITSFNSSEFWINFNNKNDYNISHSHPRSILSWVYYLTEGSPIVFQRPHGPMDFFLNEIVGSNNQTNISFSEITYRPKPNMMLFFPSFLKHYVKPSDSNNERISIVGNIAWT